MNIRASKKRIALAWYLDFLLFMVFWSLLNHFLFADKDLPFWMALVTFIVIEWVCIKIFGSIGMQFLSIDENQRVDANIQNRENWLTIFLGVILVLDGTKSLVRWMDFPVNWPFFGALPDPKTQIVINILAGCWFIATGYFFLKLRPESIWLGFITVICVLVSSVLSWSLWDETAAKMVVARRELQGLPVREGEIEFFQGLMPEGIIVATVIFGLGILFSRKRFKKLP